MAISPETRRDTDDDDSEAEHASAPVKPHAEAKTSKEQQPAPNEQQALGALVWERSREKHAVPESPEEPAEDAKKPAHETAPPSDELTPEDAEVIAELGTLSPEEAHEVALDGITNRRATIAAEQAGLDDVAETAASTAANEFLDAARQHLETDATMSVGDAASQAYEDTVNKRGLGGAAQESAHANGAAGGMQYEDSDSQPPFGVAQVFNAGGGQAHPPGPNVQPMAYNAAPGPNPNVPLWTRYAANPNVVPPRDEGAESRAFLIGLLVGGVIGNLLGRRSGRMKAEKRFKPVKEKLESEMKGVYETLAFSEDKIRKMAYANEAAKRQQRAAEADSKVRQNAERAQAAKLEQAGTARRAGTAQETAKPVHIDAEKMALKDVLETSEAIKVADTNVREIYENGLITERAARRIVNEFVRGGNFLSVLAAEMDSHARDHELDRQLRNRAPDVTGHTASGLPEPVAEDTLAGVTGHQPARQASITLPTRDPQAARDSARQMLVRANVTAAVVLGVLFVALVGIWLSRLVF